MLPSKIAGVASMVVKGQKADIKCPSRRREILVLDAPPRSRGMDVKHEGEQV